MHLTVRMAWHDHKLNGQICDKPEENTYCVRTHSLLSARIEKNRDLDFGIRCLYATAALTKCLHAIGLSTRSATMRLESNIHTRFPTLTSIRLPTLLSQILFLPGHSNFRLSTTRKTQTNSADFQDDEQKIVPSNDHRIRERRRAEL